MPKPLPFGMASLEVPIIEPLRDDPRSPNPSSAARLPATAGLPQAGMNLLE